MTHLFTTIPNRIRARLVGGCAVALLVLVAGQPAVGQGGLSVTREARAVAPGEMVVLTVRGVAAATTTLEVRAFGRAAPAIAGVEPGVWYVLVGIDLDTKPGRADVSVTARGGDTRQSVVHTLTVAPKTFGVRKLTVDPKFVTPPASAQARIDREQQRLAELIAVVDPQRYWHGPFSKPVDGAPANNFGQRSVFNGQSRGSHRGADFSSPKGAPIRAPGGGRIVLVDDLYYSGNTVLIDHGLGLFSLLAHLSRTDVRVGDLVPAGAVVGAVGATGRVTGPHLHWTLRFGSAVVDPMSLLALKGLPN
jgi:hypothetical protein